jgi:hypothetical protein
MAPICIRDPRWIAGRFRRIKVLREQSPPKAISQAFIPASPLYLTLVRIPRTPAFPTAPAHLGTPVPSCYTLVAWSPGFPRCTMEDMKRTALTLLLIAASASAAFAQTPERSHHHHHHFHMFHFRHRS